MILQCGFPLFIQFRRSPRAVLLAEDPAIPIGTIKKVKLIEREDDRSAKLQVCKIEDFPYKDESSPKKASDREF